MDYGDDNDPIHDDTDYDVCVACIEYFKNQDRTCTASTMGECDCPHCQGICECLL